MTAQRQEDSPLRPGIALIGFLACLLASIFTVLLADAPHRAAMAWCVGTLVAAVAMRERLRTM